MTYPIGCGLIFTNIKRIIKNETLLFCLLISSSLFVLAFFGSFKYNLSIRYYYPFYFSFILLFISLGRAGSIKWLRFSIYVNFIIVLSSSLGLIAPQLSVGANDNYYYDKNYEIVGQALQKIITPQDILIAAPDLGDDLSIFFNANHINTYFANPGLFIWQAPLQNVIAANKNTRIFYLSDSNTSLPEELHLSCQPVKIIIATSRHDDWPNRTYSSPYSLSQCTPV